MRKETVTTQGDHPQSAGQGGQGGVCLEHLGGLQRGGDIQLDPEGTERLHSSQAQVMVLQVFCCL